MSAPIYTNLRDTQPEPVQIALQRAVTAIRPEHKVQDEAAAIFIACSGFIGTGDAA